MSPLAEQALATDLGQRLIARRLTRAVLIALANGSEDAEREIAHGLLDSPDGGESMALARFRELPDDERERLALWARDNARRRCQHAADELIAAALDLGCDAEVEPEAVALLAAGPGVGRAMQR